MTYQLPPELDPMAFQEMTRPQLQAVAKKYYDALCSIAEIECFDHEGSKKSKSCFDDPTIECEHNFARTILLENPMAAPERVGASAEDKAEAEETRAEAAEETQDPRVDLDYSEGHAELDS